jgi:hypothetical protein
MRTRGAKDLKRRHRRSDVGKKREFYSKKKTKPRRKINGKFVPYVSKRRRDGQIKIAFWSIEPMSNQGLMNFSPDVRRKMRRVVYGRNRLRLDVDPEVLSSREAIAELVQEYLWTGQWLLMLWSNSKNLYHCSPRGFAVIKIVEHPEGMKVKVIPSFKRRSLRRLWFWRDS